VSNVPFVELPAADALVEVVLADGRTHAMRVVGVQALTLTVAAIRSAAGVAQPRPGDAVTLRWANRRGRCAGPGLVRSVHPVQFATWTIEAGGMVEVEQRRQFARASAHGPVHVGPDEPDVGTVLLGHLLDISEGGLRCRLAAPGLDPDQPVFIRLLLDDRLVTVSGRVLRLVADRPDAGVEAVLVFETDSAQSEAIRRYVLNRQRRDREVRTDGTR